MNRSGLYLFIVALVLRAGWVAFQWQRAGPALEFDDERVHWAMASNLVQTGQMVTDDGRLAARMPLYPLFLALFASAGDYGILMARLAQAVLGAVTVWLVCHMARTALGARAALVAGALACLDPYAIFFTNLLLSEVAFTVAAIGLTSAAWQALSRRSRDVSAGRMHTWGGAFLGVALLSVAAVFTRPSALGWVILLWLLLWLYEQNERRATLRLLGCAGVLVLFMLPWGLRNQHAIGSFAWLSTNGGVTLYDGQGPQADGSSNQEFLARMPELAELGEGQRDQFLRARAIEQMKRDPMRVLRLAGTKFLRTWTLVPNFEGYRAGLTGIVSALFTVMAVALAGVGLYRTAFGGRSRLSPRYQALVWLPVVYFTLLHCMFVGSLRYRVPLMPFLGLSAAAVVVARPNDRPER